MEYKFDFSWLSFTRKNCYDLFLKDREYHIV